LVSFHLQASAQELEKKNNEIKRKDRKLRDMEAQMKELQDSLNKAKWEAEQGGSEGGVKEMAEEEMEVSFSSFW
jgi:predicted  nucleic acid-binding Zn-ribbon protein